MSLMKIFFLLSLGILLTVPITAASDTVSLEPIKSLSCDSTYKVCHDFDALVFVHGIYGSSETFKNPQTEFYWPAEIPARIAGREIDTYTLEYQTEMISWAKNNNTSFDAIALAVFEKLKPLRNRQYRSIGFIAHSLGGNVISTYIHKVKTSRGHAGRSQHGYVITLATPVLGSQVANLGSYLKSKLGMTDDLLNSLTKNNLYLRMLNEFRNDEIGKGERHGCRPVHLHAGYEKDYLGPLLVVSEDSAAISVSDMVNSPVIGFDLDHSQMAKPANKSHPIYKWTMSRVRSEMVRLGNWEFLVLDKGDNKIKYTLCEKAEFIPE